LFESIPWQRATIVSGILESLLALLALLSWYSISVTTWAANLLAAGGFCTGPGDWFFRIGRMAPASVDLVHRIFRHRRCGAHVGRNFH